MPATISKAKKKSRRLVRRSEALPRPDAMSLRSFQAHETTVYVSYVVSAFATASATLPVFTTHNFVLTTITSSADLVNMYDQYCVKELEVSFYPRNNAVDVPANNAGIFATVIDYDDSTNLTSIGLAASYQTAMIRPGYESQRRTFAPRIAVGAYAGAFTSFANQVSWIDSASTGVQHYGIKTVWTACSSASYVMDLVGRVKLGLRGVRLL